MDDEIDNLLDDIVLTSPWVDLINKTCPYCGKTLEWKPGDLTPNVAQFKCECGFSGVASAPEALRDRAWDSDTIVVDV